MYKVLTTTDELHLIGGDEYKCRFECEKWMVMFIGNVNGHREVVAVFDINSIKGFYFCY